MQLAISRLIEYGLRVYIPLQRTLNTIIVETEDSRLHRCKCVFSTADKSKNPIVKLYDPDDREKPDMVAVIDKLTKTVWLFPASIIKDKQSVRLGKPYEQFIIPEPTSLDYQQQKEIRQRRHIELREKAKLLASLKLPDKGENE